MAEIDYTMNVTGPNKNINHYSGGAWSITMMPNVVIEDIELDSDSYLRGCFKILDLEVCYGLWAGAAGLRSDHKTQMT